MKPKRKALGRGLSALIPEQVDAPAGRQRSADHFLCPIERIRPRAGQPRRYFDAQLLTELAASIEQQGVVQPLVVRATEDGHYVLIAGERRWRAAQKAGLHEVPVVVRQVDDLRAFEMALVENIQREDLNPIEEAEAYQRLVGQHGYTQEKLAGQLGRDRSTIANSLRLLKLPQPAKEALISAAIATGHARALLALETDDLICAALREVIARSLSVRQTEALVKKLRETEPTKPAPTKVPNPNAQELEERLSRVLATRVKLRLGKKNDGKIEINYASLDELDRLLEVLLR